MTSPVLYHAESGVATVSMNRPERRNSFTIQMVDQLLDGLERAENDPSVRAVIVRSTGDTWCVGRDNSDTNPPPYPPGDHLKGRTALMHYARLVTFMYEMTTPTVAEIRGGCAGAGMSFALNCDLRYASTTAVMSTAFVKVAFGGDLGAPWQLTKMIGSTRAKELMLLSPKIRGTELINWGLVNEVLPDDELNARVAYIAAQLAAQAPSGMTAAKRNLQAAQTMSLGEYLPQEADYFGWCAASPDADEARLAFVEKRAPNFDRA